MTKSGLTEVMAKRKRKLMMLTTKTPPQRWTWFDCIALIKKPMTLDRNGLLYNNMKECLANDIKKLAKSLDPTYSWESQPSLQREQLFRQLYKDKEVHIMLDFFNFSIPEILFHAKDAIVCQFCCVRIGMAHDQSCYSFCTVL